MNKKTIDSVLTTLYSYQKKVETLQAVQSDIAMEFIIQEAQKILREYPELTCYCQGAGQWSFYDLFETPVTEVDGVHLTHDTTIAQIFHAYGDVLNLLHNPVKITKNLQTGDMSIEGHPYQ